MGELIKKLAKGKLLKSNFDTELNKPLVKGQDQQIHIQSDKFRLELFKKDFIKYGAAILLAEKNLKTLKEIE